MIELLEADTMAAQPQAPAANPSIGKQLPNNNATPTMLPSTTGDMNNLPAPEPDGNTPPVPDVEVHTTDVWSALNKFVKDNKGKKIKS